MTVIRGANSFAVRGWDSPGPYGRWMYQPQLPIDVLRIPEMGLVRVPQIHLPAKDLLELLAHSLHFAFNRFTTTIENIRIYVVLEGNPSLDYGSGYWRRLDDPIQLGPVCHISLPW